MQVLSCCRIRSLHHGFWVVAFTKKDCLPRETVPCVAVVVPALMMLPLIALTAPFDRPFINLTLDLGYFDLEIVVHLDRLTLIGS